jgi:hypothetical protein
MKKIDKLDTHDKITTIKVTMSVRDELAKLGTMDDNYATVIGRLIKFYKENKQ